MSRKFSIARNMQISTAQVVLTSYSQQRVYPHKNVYQNRAQKRMKIAFSPRIKVSSFNITVDDLVSSVGCCTHTQGVTRVSLSLSSIPRAAAAAVRVQDIIQSVPTVYPLISPRGLLLLPVFFLLLPPPLPPTHESQTRARWQKE